MWSSGATEDLASVVSVVSGDRCARQLTGLRDDWP
jgi:hypothetical protein